MLEKERILGLRVQVQRVSSRRIGSCNGLKLHANKKGVAFGGSSSEGSTKDFKKLHAKHVRNGAPDFVFNFVYPSGCFPLNGNG